MTLPSNFLHTRDWVWHGWQVRYQFAGMAQEAGAPPVLLLHGFGASGRHWRHNVEALSISHRVYTLDLLGFGASEKVATYYFLSVWVEQVYDFWRSLMGEPMIVVGNSLGALIALMVAHRYPETVKGVVTISVPDLAEIEQAIPPAVRPLKQFLEGTIGGILALPLFYFLRQPMVIRSVLRQFVYGIQSKDAVDRELVEIIAGPAQERQAALAFAYLNKGRTADLETPQVKKIIALLKVPLLIVWGGNDRVIPPRLGKKLATYSPLAEVLIFPGLGHCPHDESPKQVNQAILQWISRSIG